MGGLALQLRLVRRRDFGLLWWGGLVSRIGDGFTIVAVSWLLTERDSPGTLGLFFLAYEIAAIAGGLTLSGVMDAYSRRKLMVLDSLVRAGAVAIIPAAGLFRSPGLAALLPSAAILGFFSPTADVGSRALTVDLVASHELNAGNALEQVQLNAAWLAGPVLAGVAVHALGALSALWVDAGTFVVFALALAGMSARTDRIHRSDASQSFLRDLREGLGYIRGEPVMVVIIQLTSGARLAEGAELVALPFLVAESGGGSTAYGLLVTAAGVGSLAGALAMGAIAARIRATHAVTALTALTGTMYLAVALKPPLWAIGVIFASWGLLAAPWNVYLLTLRQRLAPPALLGRVLSLTMLSIRAGQPAGAGLGGALVRAIGPAGVFASVGGLMLANAAASLASRRWRTLPMRVSEGSGSEGA